MNPSFLVRFVFLAAVLPAVALMSTWGTGPAMAGGKTVRVGVYENAPKVFTAEDGRESGVFIDVINHIAKMEGWTLEYVHGTWGQGLDRLENAEIDLMTDVAHSADREKLFAFHKVPVLSSWFQIYAPKGHTIKSILDLNGKRVTVLERSVQQDVFARMASDFELDITFIPLPDYSMLFEAVARGEADAAITNRFFGLMHARQFNLEDTAIIFHPTHLFFAAPLTGRADLLSAIDRHLTRLKQDTGSVYYTSLSRWTSETVSFTLPLWARTTGLVIALALVMSLLGGILLKHQVNVRTRELRRINREMEDRIRQRTRELAVAMEQALAADHLKSAFLASMSHELRTPLNSIIGFTGILLQGLAGPLTEEQQKQLRMVQTSARHLLALINDVLDISKIEAGQLTLSMETFDLKTSIEKTVGLVAPMAGNKGLSLELDISPRIGKVTTDQRRLEQVLINLLNNAVKFTEKGGIRVACEADKGDYVLSVADTGMGIQTEDLPKLFHPFRQIDTGLARKHEGTGLGLSICKKLITRMGGTIQVDSRWQEGSTFTVRFPEHKEIFNGSTAAHH